MNTQKTAVALFVLAILAMFLLPGLVNSQSGIIVNNADSVLTTDATFSQDLVDTTSSAAPRNVLQYADSSGHYALASMPAALQTLAEAVTPRNIIQYADSTAHYDLAAAPTALQTFVNAVTPRNVLQYADSTAHYDLALMSGSLQLLVWAVTPRNVVQYADSTRTMALGYPLDLMDDSSPPQIGETVANAISNDAAVITWTTDEFADSEVVYGQQSGQYPSSAGNPLFVKQHAITLTLLSPATTYYYQTRSADRSGNTAQSAEYYFIIESQSAPNQAPHTPSNPLPVDGATNVPTSQVLSWEGGDPDGDVVTYTVAFGAVNPPPVVATSQIASYTPPIISDTANLFNSTRYYWMITTTDGFSQSVGPIWTFMTIETMGTDFYLYLPLVLK